MEELDQINLNKQTVTDQMKNFTLIQQDKNNKKQKQKVNFSQIKLIP